MKWSLRPGCGVYKRGWAAIDADMRHLTLLLEELVLGGLQVVGKPPQVHFSVQPFPVTKYFRRETAVPLEKPVATYQACAANTAEP